MEDFIIINDRIDIVRDNNSKALLSVDINKKTAWLSKKEKNKKIIDNEIEINNIKSELDGIKTMLEQIVERIK